MAVWGLVVETTVGMGERKHVEAYVLGHVEGEREEALAELERRARQHTPEHPRSPRRRRLFRTSDGFLLVTDGSWQSFSTRFTLAELLEDSAAPRPPAAPEPEPGSGPEPGTGPAAGPGPASGPECDEDGVPLRPAWLGRPDLS
ncbi:hypothetical protein IHE55_03830 [Streptomyces pactum]|uniref:Uncharacterized protein n=1 Tax=Streptomyces pactum TaxID=68249 RepID=A0ABS0NFN5_9ACTN|nr:hypothetical protein [Streptomyces pactum]MBH5333978.1 hypothetical protein [Streptomyces pactum]